MVDDAEWDWIAEHAVGGHDHLLIGTSVPWLLGPALHYLEAWDEAVAGGAWGRLGSWAGEKLRRANDLEHWAAFNASFERLAELQRSVGAGERGEAPASIVTLSGDVHHAYLFEVAFKRDAARAQPRLPGGLLALPQPARRPRATRDPCADDPQRSRRHAHAGEARRRGRPERALAPGRRRAVVRQPGRDAHRSTGAEIAMRLDKAVPVDEHHAELDRVLEHRLA